MFLPHGVGVLLTGRFPNVFIHAKPQM